VITGGTALMPGMVELGEEVFHMPVRVGIPKYEGGFAEVIRSPRYATSVGLLMAGFAAHEENELTRLTTTSFKQVMERMRSWFQNF